MMFYQGYHSVFFRFCIILLALHVTDAWYDRGCQSSCCDNSPWCEKMKASDCYREEFMCCKRCNKLRIKDREDCEWGDKPGCYPDQLFDPAECVGERLKACCDRCDEILDDEYIEAWNKKKAVEEKERKSPRERSRGKKEFYDD